MTGVERSSCLTVLRISARAVVFITTAAAIYSRGHGLRTYWSKGGNVTMSGRRGKPLCCFCLVSERVKKVKLMVKFSHTRYRALGPELIPVYRQSARR